MDTQPTDSHEASTSTPAPVMPQNTTRVVMGVLAYLGILVVVSYLVSKDDPFVRFHIKQGLVLFVGEIILWIAGYMLSYLPGVGGFPLFGIINILDLIIFVFAIIGIVNVLQGKEKELPLVGHLGARFNI